MEHLIRDTKSLYKQLKKYDLEETIDTLDISNYSDSIQDIIWGVFNRLIYEASHVVGRNLIRDEIEIALRYIICSHCDIMTGDTYEGIFHLTEAIASIQYVDYLKGIRFCTSLDNYK